MNCSGNNYIVFSYTILSDFFKYMIVVIRRNLDTLREDELGIGGIGIFVP